MAVASALAGIGAVVLRGQGGVSQEATSPIIEK